MGEGGITLRELDARPVTDLNGVGEARARALAAAEVHSILDLLGFYPRRYLDRTREATVAGLSIGDEGMVLVRRKGTGGKNFLHRCVIHDRHALPYMFA